MTVTSSDMGRIDGQLREISDSIPCINYAIMLYERTMEHRSFDNPFRFLWNRFYRHLSQ